MNCNIVKHIIDQIRNRELPESALCDITWHLEKCECCRKYFEEGALLSELVLKCDNVKNDADDVFSRLEEKLEKEEFKKSLIQYISETPFIKAAAVITLVIILLSAGFLAHYLYSISNQNSMSEKKINASLRRIPDNGILVKSSEGHETIYTEPAVMDDATAEKMIQELEEIMNSDKSITEEEYHVVSY
jgi:predicted transcriptional regulator